MRSQVGFEPERRSSHQYLCIDFRTLHGEFETFTGSLQGTKIEACPPRVFQEPRLTIGTLRAGVLQINRLLRNLR